MKLTYGQICIITNLLNEARQAQLLQNKPVLKANLSFLAPEASKFFEQLSVEEREHFWDVEIEVGVKLVQKQQAEDLPLHIYNGLEPIIKDFEPRKTQIEKLAEEYRKQEDETAN